MLKGVYSTTGTIKIILWCPLFFSSGGETFGVSNAPDWNILF